MSLEDRLESGLPRAWRPDQDDPDILIGEVLEIEVGTSDFGRYPILVVRQDDGEALSFHAFHSVAQNELVKHKPQIGERVGIKYLGDVPTKPGSPYKSYKGYRVKVDREAGTAFNWNQIATDPDADAYAQVGEQEQTVTVPAGAGEDDIPF